MSFVNRAGGEGFCRGVLFGVSAQKAIGKKGVLVGVLVVFRGGLSGLKWIPYKGLNTFGNWVIGGFFPIESR